MTRNQPKAPRQAKTPAQRAQETVAVLERRAGRLVKQRQALEEQIDALGRESRDVERRLKHARQNPDLPENTEPQETPAS